jgi:hypothetical protein
VSFDHFWFDQHGSGKSPPYAPPCTRLGQCRGRRRHAAPASSPAAAPFEPAAAHAGQSAHAVASSDARRADGARCLGDAVGVDAAVGALPGGERGEGHGGEVGLHERFYDVVIELCDAAAHVAEAERVAGVRAVWSEEALLDRELLGLQFHDEELEARIILGNKAGEIT